MSVVLITGCSSGIGLETALAFARRGDTVYATMRNLARAGICYVALGRPSAYVETGMAWRIDDGSPKLHAFREIAEATKTPQTASREGPSARRRIRG